MQKYKVTRLFLVPAVAFSLTAGAVLPVVANAQSMDNNLEETTQVVPQQRGRLARITSVDGTHYTADIIGHHGRGFKGMGEPPADLEEGERPELPLDDSERPDRPERKFSEDIDSEDGANPFKDMLPNLDADSDEATDEADRPERGRFGKSFEANDEAVDTETDEDRPFKGGRGRHGMAEDIEDMAAETIEFDADGKDLAVDDIVELTFDGDTVTDVQKLGKDSMPEKPERGFRKDMKQENVEDTSDNSQA